MMYPRVLPSFCGCFPVASWVILKAILLWAPSFGQHGQHPEPPIKMRVWPHLFESAVSVAGDERAAPLQAARRAEENSHTQLECMNLEVKSLRVLINLRRLAFV
eukprot:3941028-Prymnesium_polylepis.1